MVLDFVDIAEILAELGIMTLDENMHTSHAGRFTKRGAATESVRQHYLGMPKDMETFFTSGEMGKLLQEHFERWEKEALCNDFFKLIHTRVSEGLDNHAVTGETSNFLDASGGILDDIRKRIEKAFQKSDKEEFRAAVEELKDLVPEKELKAFAEKIKSLHAEYTADMVFVKTAKQLPDEFGLLNRTAESFKTTNWSGRMMKGLVGAVGAVGIFDGVRGAVKDISDARSNEMMPTSGAVINDKLPEKPRSEGALKRLAFHTVEAVASGGLLFGSLILGGKTPKWPGRS